MSRVAKAPVTVPKGVEVVLTDNNVNVSGPKGKLEQTVNSLVSITMEDNVAHFAPKEESREGWAQAGTARALLNNMVQGVSQGFERKLELIGVGYRAQLKGKSLNLSLGFSHPIDYALPEGVTAAVEGNTVVTLTGIDKQLLGQTAAVIRSFRPPEPYKGKGVRYFGENIKRKETKKK